jgi:hypothetical protein
MMRTTSVILLTCCVLLGAQNESRAQTSSPIAGLAGSPFRMGFGARGIAMGNAMSSNPRGHLAAYYNPALAPFQVGPSAHASFGVLSLDRRLNFLSYGQALQPTGGMIVGVIDAGVNNIEYRDVNGRLNGTFATHETAFLFSFGTRMTDIVSAGISAKILYHSLFSEVSSTTLAIDAGALLSLSASLKAGLVIQDINGKYKWDTSPVFGRRGNATTEKFPLRRRLSLTYLTEYYDSSVSGEFEYVDSTPFLRIGIELHPVAGFAFRIGVDQIDPDGVVPARPSFGIGFRTDVESMKPEIQYAYVHEPYAPSGMHFISVIVHF